MHTVTHPLPRGAVQTQVIATVALARQAGASKTEAAEDRDWDGFNEPSECETANAQDNQPIWLREQQNKHRPRARRR